MDTFQLPNRYSNLPKGQKILLQYINSDGDVYAVTRDISEVYFLYLVQTNKKKLTKVRTGNSPLKFKEIYKNQEIKNLE